MDKEKLLKSTGFKITIIIVPAILFLSIIIGVGIKKIKSLYAEQNVQQSAEVESFSFDIGIPSQEKEEVNKELTLKEALRKKVETYRQAEQEQAEGPKPEQEISFSSVFTPKDRKSTSKQETRTEVEAPVRSHSRTRQGSLAEELAEIKFQEETPQREVSVHNPSREEIHKEIRQIYRGEQNPKKQEDKQPSQEELLLEKKRELEAGISVNASIESAATPGNEILECAIQGDQTVKSGGRVTMRLLDECRMSDGTLIPRNTYIFGIVTISDNRARISVQSIRVGSEFIAVQLNAYGSDGMNGIPLNVDYIKKAIDKESGDEIKEAIDRSTLGRSALGSIISGTFSSSRRERQQEITLIDAQRVILK